MRAGRIEDLSKVQLYNCYLTVFFYIVCYKFGLAPLYVSISYYNLVNFLNYKTYLLLILLGSKMPLLLLKMELIPKGYDERPLIKFILNGGFLFIKPIINKIKL